MIGPPPTSEMSQMKRLLYVLPAVLLVHLTAFAQTEHFIPRESFENTVLGWMKVYNFSAPRKPLKVDDKLYSPAQLAFADAFANWIQASYLPKGGLGDVRILVSEKLGQYTATDAARPQAYGALAKTYTELKYDANKKMVPATNSHLRWLIMANSLTFGEPLQVLNTPTDYYFLMPLFGEPISKGDPDDRQIRERYDLSNHPAVKRYITYFNLQTYSSQYANSSNVLLCRDNKLPFVKVTKAEYLDKLAAAIERKVAKEKEQAIQSWPEGKTRTSALADVDARYQKRTAALQSARTKYQGRLQEIAEVTTLQPDVMLENNPAIFAEASAAGRHYPVYKVDPALAALAKSDQPQWVLISWDGNITHADAKYMQDAILNNFDFQYAYDFVFNPEKVKGQPYKPLRQP